MRSGRLFVSSLIAVALLLAAGPGPAQASMFLKEDVQSLKQRAEAVVRASVVDVRSYWNADATMIFTDVTLVVKGRLHGSSDNRIVVRVPGGTVGDFSVDMEGAPRFSVGEDVVAFVARWDDGVPMVAGYFQGVSRIRRDSAGNEMLQGGVADGLAMSELARQLHQAGR